VKAKRSRLGVGVALLCGEGLDSLRTSTATVPRCFFETLCIGAGQGKTQKMKKILLSVLALLALAGSGMAQQWYLKAPMSVKRASAAATVCNGFIYVVGGTSPDSSETLHLNERFNPLSNTWELLAPMPTPRGELGLASVNGKIFAIGGGNTSGTLSTVEMYDPNTNSWTTKSPMPTPRSTTSVTVINNLIYCAGDWPNATGVLEIYNPATDTWTTGSPMLQGRVNTHSFCSANGLGYFIGGKNSAGEILPGGEIYNPANNTWTAMPSNLPEARWAGTCVELNGKIHYIGGSIVSNIYSPTNSNFVFNISNNQWTIGNTMNIARADFSSAVFNGKIYVFGGRNTNTESMFNSVEEYSVFSGNCPDLSGSLLQGLVGYWPFCGNANDESGNGNNGTVNGATLTTDRFGNAGKAYDFDGVDDKISCLNQFFNSGAESYSIAVWARSTSLNNPNNINDSQVLINTDPHRGFEIAYSGSNNPFTNSIDNKVVVVAGDGANWTEINLGSLKSGDDFKINQWQQILSVKENNKFYLYVNGILEDTYTVGSASPSVPSSIVFGNLGPGFGNECFWGKLDDIAIWNRALSSEEISQLYQIQACTTPLLLSLQNPPTITGTPGASMQLQAQANLDSTRFRWESDAAGLGWMAIQNNAHYNGADSARLQVSNIALANHLQRFRVLGQSGGCRDTSEVVTLQLSDTCINTITVNDTNLVSVTDTLLIDAPVFTAGNPPQFNTLKVYPVPATNMLYINTGNYASMPGYSIKITRINGQDVVFEAEANEPLLEIPLADFGANGVYFLNLYNASGALVTSRKIVLY
jgi:N-acetylneuraminic acid mutarotase